MKNELLQQIFDYVKNYLFTKESNISLFSNTAFMMPDEEYAMILEPHYNLTEGEIESALGYFSGSPTKAYQATIEYMELSGKYLNKSLKYWENNLKEYIFKSQNGSEDDSDEISSILEGDVNKTSNNTPKNGTTNPESAYGEGMEQHGNEDVSPLDTEKTEHQSGNDGLM